MKQEEEKRKSSLFNNFPLPRWKMDILFQMAYSISCSVFFFYFSFESQNIERWTFDLWNVENLLGNFYWNFHNTKIHEAILQNHSRNSNNNFLPFYHKRAIWKRRKISQRIFCRAADAFWGSGKIEIKTIKGTLRNQFRERKWKKIPLNIQKRRQRTMSKWVESILQKQCARNVIDIIWCSLFFFRAF